MAFLLWAFLICFAQSFVNAVFLAFISGCLVALGILTYQSKSIKIGLPYRRQTKVIDLAFEDWRVSKNNPELWLIRIFQPGFFAAIFVLLISEVAKWLT